MDDDSVLPPLVGATMSPAPKSPNLTDVTGNLDTPTTAVRGGFVGSPGPFQTPVTPKF